MIVSRWRWENSQMKKNNFNDFMLIMFFIFYLLIFYQNLEFK